MDHLIELFIKDPQIDLLKTILGRITDSLNEYYIDDELNTLLHVRQEKETIKLLLDEGGDPNNMNINGATPVLLQKSCGTIELLFNAGANLHHRDNYDFGIFHWQKDLESVFFLYEDGVDLNIFNYIYEPKSEPVNSQRNRMLIEGGYDPYNEKYISIPGYFLQRDSGAIHAYLYLRNKFFPEFKNSTDLFHESILFKTFLSPKVMTLYTDKEKGGEDVNTINFFNNTALFIHHDVDIIITLLNCGADITHLNNEGDRPLEHHQRKNNKDASRYLLLWEKSMAIQRCWKSWKYRKNYVPFKNYLKKKEFLFEIHYLPPLLDGKFKGGIEYQLALEDFTFLSSLQ